MPNPPKISATDHDALTLLLKDPMIRQATRALFKGDRERVENLLRERVDSLLREKKERKEPLKMDEAMVVWLLAHAVESNQKDTDLPEAHTGDIDKPAKKDDRSTELLRLVGKSNAQIYQNMANDILKRNAEIDRMMLEPPGWQGWFIRRKRGLIRGIVALGVSSVLLLLGLWLFGPPPVDPLVVARATAAVTETQMAGTQAAILALTPTVTPPVTPMVGVRTSGSNKGIGLIIDNCGYSDVLDVVQGSSPVARPAPGAGYSYFFLNYSATCGDSTDNVCSMSQDLVLSLRLSNNSSVPDVGFRVAGQVNSDFLVNGQSGTGWLVFNIIKNEVPMALQLASADTSGFSGTATPAPVSIDIPLPCKVQDS